MFIFRHSERLIILLSFCYSKYLWSRLLYCIASAMFTFYVFPSSRFAQWYERLLKIRLCALALKPRLSNAARKIAFSSPSGQNFTYLRQAVNLSRYCNLCIFRVAVYVFYLRVFLFRHLFHRFRSSLNSRINIRYFDLNVNSVKQRTGYSTAITINLCRSTGTLVHDCHRNNRICKGSYFT